MEESKNDIPVKDQPEPEIKTVLGGGAEEIQPPAPELPPHDPMRDVLVELLLSTFDQGELEGLTNSQVTAIRKAMQGLGLWPKPPEALQDEYG